MCPVPTPDTKTRRILMSVSSIYNSYNVTYSPEWGRCAKPKDNPDSKVGIYWGKEFEQKMRSTIAQAAQRQAEAAKNAPPRTKLTDAEIKELASKYNPSSMSRAEYDSFLEELEDKGVLTHQELQYMGYKGIVVLDLTDHSGLKLTPVQINPNDPMAQKWMYGGYALTNGLSRINGSPEHEEDLTLSAKLYDMFTPTEKKAAYSYYGALYDVVRRMDSIRA